MKNAFLFLKSFNHLIRRNGASEINFMIIEFLRDAIFNLEIDENIEAQNVLETEKSFKIFFKNLARHKFLMKLIAPFQIKLNLLKILFGENPTALLNMIQKNLKFYLQVSQNLKEKLLVFLPLSIILTDFYFNQIFANYFLNDILLITTKQETVPIRLLYTVYADIIEYVKMNFEILHSHFEKSQVKSILTNFDFWLTFTKKTFFEVF